MGPKKLANGLFSTHQAAMYCNVTMATISNWVKDGSIKAYKTKGGHRRIKKEDLLQFMNKHKIPVPDDNRILVVDDDASIQKGLKKLFEKEGYKVDVAGNGFEAGLLVERSRPALVVLDLMMAGFNGFFVCDYIRKVKGLKRIKIVVLTGYPSKDNMDKIKKAGADKCIAKPVENAKILKEVKDLIS